MIKFYDNRTLHITNGILGRVTMADAKARTAGGRNFLTFFKDPTMIFAAAIVVTVMMLIIPIPSWMLDALMATSILMAVIITLTVTYIKDPVEFSIFPTLLLFTTIFRLAINVSSTKLILSQGVNFDGHMVRAFGSFVVGSTDVTGMIIGAIIFIMLVLVQFIVITRGTTRVSEVAARFSLDSMNNQFMAIDMDMSNGYITEEQAIKKRQNLMIKSQFYGNMDGASKFVQGDVIMGILLTLTNIIGGLAVGILARSEDAAIAAQNYIPLTIGDGLVSQIPSLLIGVATGLIVTRSQADDAIGTQMAQQLIKDYRIFLIAGAVMTVMALLPGFPHIVLIMLALAMFGAAYLLNRSQTRKEALEKKKQAGEAGTQAGAASAADNTEELIKDDILSLLIGYELIPLLDKSKGGELLSSISSTRGQVAIATGVPVPKIRIKDNLQLQSNEYEIKIKGQTVAKYSVIIDRLLAIGSKDELGEIQGIKTHDPAYGNEAYWITDDMTESAEAKGYSVVDASAVICTHIQEVLRSHMDEILTRENVKQMIEGVRIDSPTIASEIDRMYQTLAPIQNVLKILLQEDVPVRDKETIFEILTDNPATTPPFKMAELIRQSLKRAIVTPYLTDKNELFVMKIDPRIEQALFKVTQYTDLGEPIVQLSANEAVKFKQLFIEKMDKMRADGYYPIIQTAPEIRRAVWNLLRSNDARLSVAVISNMEIPADTAVCLYGVISAQSKAA